MFLIRWVAEEVWVLLTVDDLIEPIRGRLKEIPRAFLEDNSADPEGPSEQIKDRLSLRW